MNRNGRKLQDQRRPDRSGRPGRCRVPSTQAPDHREVEPAESTQQRRRGRRARCSIDRLIASLDCDGATIMITIALMTPVTNQTAIDSDLRRDADQLGGGRPLRQGAQPRADAACGPAAAAPRRPPRSTASPSPPSAWLITTPPTVERRRPAMIGANGCGLLPNRMNDREMRSRSGPTVIADRVVVSDSDSQVAAISPMTADSSPPMTTPISDPSQIGHVGCGHRAKWRRTRRTSRSRPGRSSPPGPAAPSA